MVITNRMDQSISVNDLKKVFDFEILSEDQDCIKLGKCIHPNCKTPDKYILTRTCGDQGGTFLINGMSWCQCFQDDCLLKDATHEQVICNNCIEICDVMMEHWQTYYQSLDEMKDDMFICSRNVLKTCPECNKKACDLSEISYGGIYACFACRDEHEYRCCSDSDS